MRALLLAVVVGLVPVVLWAGCPKPSCLLNTDCTAGEVCVVDPAGGGHGTRTCVNACAADLRCPAGQACVPRDDGSFEGACLGITGSTKLGDGCTSDRDCTTGICEGSTGSSTCVDGCDLGIPCPDTKDRCTLDGLRHVCVPPAGNVAAGDPCTSSTQCTSGTCVIPPGATAAACADNCSDAVKCTVAGESCVRLEGGARACLVPLADGGVCSGSSECAGGFCITDFDGVNKCASSCSATGTCAATFSCETDVDSNGDGKTDANDKPVCMPALDTKAAGQTCAHARECVSGHCAHFAAGTLDETLCADPCATDGTCTTPDVCWKDPSPHGTDVCGPAPPP